MQQGSSTVQHLIDHGKRSRRILLNLPVWKTQEQAESSAREKPVPLPTYPIYGAIGRLRYYCTWPESVNQITGKWWGREKRMHLRLQGRPGRVELTAVGRRLTIGFETRPPGLANLAATWIHYLTLPIAARSWAACVPSEDDRLDWASRPSNLTPDVPSAIACSRGSIFRTTLDCNDGRGTGWWTEESAIQEINWKNRKKKKSRPKPWPGVTRLVFDSS